MNINTFQKKLEKALYPRKTFIDKIYDSEKHFTRGYKGECLRIALGLERDCVMVGFMPLDYEPDIDAIVDQVATLEAKGAEGAVYIMDGTIAIVEDAFKNCHGNLRDMITEISLPESITKIYRSAFFGCMNLKSIVIPSEVKEIGDWAFFDCDALESVVLPEGLTHIGNNAFSYCKNLNSINIPSSLEVIGENAFSGCSLQDLSFENEHFLFDKGLVIDKLKNELVSICSKPTSIKIPEGIPYIGRCTFFNCVSLRKVELPESVSEIREGAFCGCKILKSITIPYGITKIEESTFKNCSSLEYVDLPDSVIEIDSRAFEGCSSLKSVTFPMSIEKIGEYAFANCRSLSEVTIPNADISLEKTSWDTSAFEHCENLRLVNLPKGLSWSIVKSKFKGTPYSKENPNPTPAKAKRDRIKRMNAATIENLIKALTGDMGASVEQKDTNIIIKAKLAKGSLLYAEVTKEKDALADEINFDSVKAAVETAPAGALVIVGITQIKGEMFSNNKDFSTIIFPEGLREIGYLAFSECSSLKSIVIPDGVTKIKWKAFSNCSSLESVVLPQTLTEIEEGLFYGCKALSSITIPNPQTIESIKSTSFFGCDLKDLTFENDHWLLKGGLIINKDEKEIIGTYRNDLEEVIIPEWITKIRASAFASCIAIKSVTIPEGITEIDYSTFENCTSLKKVEIPDSVKLIKGNAFKNCTSLRSIKLPHGLTEIGLNAFDRCSSLEQINLPESLTQLGDFAFYHCSSIESLTIPEGITKIEWGTFEGCTSLHNVSLPTKLKEIGQSAFSNTNLSTITIPARINLIFERAFGDCHSLTEVNFLGLNRIKYWDPTAFAGCDSLTTVNLPKRHTWENVRDKFKDSPYGRQKPVK